MIKVKIEHNYHELEKDGSWCLKVSEWTEDKVMVDDLKELEEWFNQEYNHLNITFKDLEECNGYDLQVNAEAENRGLNICLRLYNIEPLDTTKINRRVKK